MSNIIEPSNSDRWDSPETVQNYIGYLEEIIDGVIEANLKLIEEARQLKNAYHDLTGSEWNDGEDL